MLEVKQSDLPEWQRDASCETESWCCEARRGREFIVRMNTGADPVKAIEEFARKNNIRFGKVHATFMGAFQPCRYYVWVPDVTDYSNWHYEGEAQCDNLVMLAAIGGMIGQRTGRDGKEETFVAMHFVAGGAWDNPTISGHLIEGTKVKGCMQVFVTELLDIDVLKPVDIYGEEYTLPENFYRNIAKK